MKSIAAVALIVAYVVAEPPPSNSYLPPSTRGGYPQSGQQQNSLPQVVAARSQDQFGRQDHGALGHGATNGFAGNVPKSGGHGTFGAGPHQVTGRALTHFNDQGYEQRSQGYEQHAGLARNGLDENAEPASYNFGYMVNDDHEGTDFGHHEERQEERAQGEYHVVLPDGRKQTVSYEADERGFKPQISYEETEDLGRSGYDSNANNFRSDQDLGYQDNQHGHQDHQHGHQDNQHGHQDYQHGYQGNQHGFQDNQHGYQENHEQNVGRSQNGAHARAGGYN